MRGSGEEDSSNRRLPGELTARDLLGLPGVVRQEEAAPGEGTFEEVFLFSRRTGAAGFRRRAGGARVRLSIRPSKKSSEGLMSGVARLDAERVGISDRIQSSLRERISKLAAGVPLDEGRLAQEVAQLADRADITEEIDRLKTHLGEARRLLAADGAVGRRLDHLAQELHREVNTSGSKVREAGHEARPRPEVRARSLQGTGSERRMKDAR